MTEIKLSFAITFIYGSKYKMVEDELMTHNEIYSCNDNIVGINEYRK